MSGNIQQWLHGLGLAKYAEVFAENEVDFDVLRRLGADDLKELGLPLGPRKKLMAAIAELAAAEPEPVSDDSPAREADRRQLTVMFCDLVGSTELSRHLDPEDLRGVMRRYQDAVAGAVTRYGGHVAKYLGDGVLAYFGWPQAHEDQAERAIRAALDAVDTVGDLKLEAGTALQARAGIATGQVVIGDLVGEAGAVSGETPNLAARLQDIAQPGQVAIGEATRLLIAEAFELDELGARSLKGFAEPVSAWRVVRERAVGSRFEASHGTVLTPIVGREHEIGLLLDRWAQAKRGEGQVVMLSGEAGIGKSRIAQTLRERIADEPHMRLRYQCAPYYSSTALHPFIRQLERVAGFATDDSPDIKLAKIEDVVAGSPGEVAEAVPILAALLSVPADDRYPTLQLTPQQLKEKTLQILCDQVMALAARNPVLIILEDAHWADPTTLEALERTIDRIQRARVFAVITFRPEFVPPWHGYTHVTALTLNRLGGEDCTSIVDNVAGGKGLPAEVLDQIVFKTDGVPLFVEELTKTVIESGILDEDGDRFKLTGPVPPLAIPSTLKDSLMARLDRLSSVKEVAQVGAAMGREFSFPLVAAVSTLSEPELTDALSQLVEAELLFRRGTPPDARYIFKHALVQEIAYESLLKARRQTMHQEIAAALERELPDVAETQPEILAHHYTRADLTQSALPYWQKAGERASKRGADLEAVAHFGKALTLIGALPESAQRVEQELDLCIALGPALMNSKGTASVDVQRAYSRAKDLAQLAGRRDQEFTSLWGLWLHHMVSGRLDVARSLARQALTLAEQIGDRGCLLQAHHANWSTDMQVGDLTETLDHTRQGSALYDVELHKSHAYIYGGHDPGVCAASDGALVLWLLGYPDQARDRIEEAIRIAGLLSHAHSTAHAYCYAGIVHLFRREPNESLSLSEKLRAHSEENDLELWVANAKVLCGWSLAELGRPAEGLAEFREGIDQRNAVGATPRQSLYLASLALAYCDVGDFQEAQWAIAQAFTLGERFSDPYVHLANGTIQLAETAGGDRKGEASLLTAIELARERSARSWELRSATSLAKCWCDRGKLDEARDLLSPLYSWFEEGFDTPDLKDAKVLLDELS